MGGLEKWGAKKGSVVRIEGAGKCEQMRVFGSRERQRRGLVEKRWGVGSFGRNGVC